MKKRMILTALAVAAICLAACGKKPAEPVETAAPASQAAVTTEAPTEPAKPPFQDYEYEYGGITVGVPWSMDAAPVSDDGDRITYADPEGEWTVSFTPLSVNNTAIQTNNISNLMEQFRTMGNYQNVETEETKIGGYSTTYASFEMTPDWKDAEQGYTTSYHEPHVFYVVDYGDAVVGQWGGLLINVAAPENARVELAPILEDEDLRCLLDNLSFHESDELPAVSIPGLSVSFPGRWQTGSDGDQTLWAGIRGSQSGSIFFGPSVYKNAQEAASYVSDDIRTLEFGGKTWTGGVRTAELSGTVVKNLELFTDFTDYHALYSRLSLNNWENDDDFWAFAESDAFRSVMESVVTEPDKFHNREDDMKDTSGFECNNINEISAYTGSDAEITIPASIGTNEIVGINYAVFKDNSDITSVTLSEGIVYIESDAFKGCTNLKTVVLPSSLTLIDSGAFEDCASLESVTFGDNLIELGHDAFANCSSLGDVILPESVKLIGNSAFSSAGTGTGRFVCPAEGTVYEHLAFADAQFNSVEIGPSADLSDYNIMQGFKGSSVSIGEGTESLGEYFLMDPYAADTSLTEVLLPDSLKEIGKNAFSGRMGLASIDLKHIETMGEGAFSQSGLVDIVVPGSLKVIPEDAFVLCSNAQTITIEEGVEVISYNAFGTVGSRKKADFYNFLSDEEVEEHRNVVHADEAEYTTFFDIALPSTIKEVAEDAFLATRLEGLYLLWLESADQLPEEFHPGFDSYECIYVSPETFESQGDALNDYFRKDEGFNYWAGSVRVYEGRHHYWTDEELGIDA